MKKFYIILTAAIASTVFATSCIKETVPQSSTVTVTQAAAAPGAYANFVDAITSSLAGQFTYGGDSNKYPYDFGYPSFFIMRDVMGNDIVPWPGLCRLPDALDLLLQVDQELQCGHFHVQGRSH